ncbi:hypothetical protein R1sor_002072 [Riccia sorocarpa]|uniref:Gag protein n=1 Tax=Riccia sorocarpa TaxID=122646 RepID=A0ABD3H0V0_9MARC
MARLCMEGDQFSSTYQGLTACGGARIGTGREKQTPPATTMMLEYWNLWSKYKYLAEGMNAQILRCTNLLQVIDAVFARNSPTHTLPFVAVLQVTMRMRNSKTYANQMQRIPIQTTLSKSLESAKAMARGLPSEGRKQQQYQTIIDEVSMMIQRAGSKPDTQDPREERERAPTSISITKRREH